METAFWQELDNNNFNVFIRDLSSSVNTNLKHIIEDLDNLNKETNNKTKKNIKPKKKDLIIQEQNKKRYNKLVEEDKRTIEFLLKNINDNNPYLNFNQQGYYSSINSMIGNMHLNPMVPDAQQQNNHEADFSEFRNSMLGISNDSIYENNDTDRISKLRSDSKDSGNVSFDETQLLGTFLDSPNMTPKKEVPKQNIEENLEL